MPTRELSDFFSDFLLNFVFVGSALLTVPWPNKAETDESKAAMVWVSFPGFMTSPRESATKDLDVIRP